MHRWGSGTWIGVEDRAPFNVEDLATRAALHRGEDSAACAVVAATITRGIIGALVCPQWEDSVVVRPYIRRRRQTGADVTARFVDRHKIKPSIGTDVHSVIGLIVKLERERQWHQGIAVINVVTGVGRARHDRISSLGKDVLLRRTTFDRVIPCEGCITIASFGSDRPGTNARSHAASETEVHGERSCASIDRHSGHTAASIPGQGQIAGLDRRRINRLVEVHVILIVAWCWWRKCAAIRRVSRSNL